MPMRTCQLSKSSSNNVHFNLSSFLCSGVPTVFACALCICMDPSFYMYSVYCCGTIKFKWKVVKREISIWVFRKPFIWVLGAIHLFDLQYWRSKKGPSHIQCTNVDTKMAWTLYASVYIRWGKKELPARLKNGKSSSIEARHLFVRLFDMSPLL